MGSALRPAILCWRRGSTPIHWGATACNRNQRRRAVVILVLFGALEGTYMAVAPDGGTASGNDPYRAVLHRGVGGPNPKP